MTEDIDMEKSTEQVLQAAVTVPVENPRSEKMFSLKRWNAVAMWSWDVECEICAICRVQVMGEYLITFLFHFTIFFRLV